MSEYIDKDKLLNAIECIDISNCTDVDDIFIEIERTIDEQPTADVVEVRRERWDYENSDVGGADYSCSACRNIITVSSESQDEDLYSYCPYCGAKMDGKDGTDYA